MRKTLARDWAGKAAGRALRLGLGLLAGLALLTTTVASGTLPAATFSTAVNYGVGANPHGVAAGVFSKSGHLDLAVANQNDSTVTVLLGDGRGGFAPAPGSPFSLPPGSGPIAIAVGHFTSSGNLDIVTANQSGSVTLFPGNGDGTFKPAVTTSTGSILPNAMAVGDLRGIGRFDVVVTDQLSASAGILLGNVDVNGNVTFQLTTTLALDSFPSAVVLADLRNSGKLDLAVATGSGFVGHVDIFLGNGDGTFTAASPATVAVGPVPLAVAAGNFNGHMDLLVANSNNTVSVLLGNGSGGFTAASPVSVGSMPSAIAVGDFNVDGKLDFVTANNLDNNVSVVLGNGDGTFQPNNPATFAADQGPIALAVGDFNGDGKPDLAVANQNRSLAAGGPYYVSILLNTTLAGPPPPPPISVSVAPSTASVQVNNSAQFSATVTNDSANKGVAWRLTQSGIACSPACGSVSPANTASGAATTYIAPASVPSPATVTLTASSVSDSTKSASATITVTPPPNSAPTASIAPDPPITCAGPNGAMVTLSGSGSDPDGDTLSFTWFDEHMNVIGHTAIVTVLVPPGTHTFTLQVSDGHGNVTSASTQVTVVPDTTPPTLSVSLSPNVLWPPDNKLVPITAQVQASDNCPGNPSIALFSIWSTDRDDDKTDIVIKGSSFWLRASKGDEWRDRVYTVTYKATDAAGNTAKTSATVTVPHSQAFRRADKKHGKRRLDKKYKD